ncbi:MAG TPA: hypothetical protein ENN79_02240, partial [Desulfobacteraceae bacterium]|nr:hypothetical protein [Desulfobacteraceae bacterium]
GVFIFALYVVAACIMPGKATADQAAPIVETAGGRIIVKACDVSLSKFLEQVSLRTSTPIRAVEGSDFPVTIDARFSSLEHLLQTVCVSLAVVYERQEDGGFRILRAEAYPGGAGMASGVISSDSDPPYEGELSGGSDAVGFSLTPTNGSIPSKPSGVDERITRPSVRLQSGEPRQAEGRPSYRPGQLLVQFTPGSDPAGVKALHASIGSRVLRVVHGSRIHQVALPEGADMSTAIKAYKASPIVEKVGRNSLRYPLGIVPNDPRFSEQWALGAVRAPDAWSITTGSTDVIVAVIGTGVDYKHPDLAANIWINTEELHGEPGVDDDGNGFVDDIYGWDFAGRRADVYDDGTPEPMDVFGHGTQVAGIIGAVGDNGIGIAGVCWRTNILPLKVLADDSDTMEMPDIIAAIDYAIAAGVRVVNCSFGGTDPNINPDGSMNDGTDNLEWEAFSRLREAGILAVCAAGNSGRDNDQTPLYPASYRLGNIISVAWQAEKGGLSRNSNYGKNSVHLAAPGEKVLSTASNAGLTGGWKVPLDDDALYVLMSGTSAATPHVSAAAALIYSVCPSMDYLQTRAAILGSVKPFPSSTDREKIFSGGTLDVFGALRFLGFIKGDVDVNGRVDPFDAVLLLRYSAGLIELNDLQKQNGNMTGHEDDDDVGVPDAVEILRLLSGARGEQAQQGS